MTGLPAACAALLGTGELAMPWLLPYRACGSGVAHHVAAGMPVAQALNLALQAQPIPMPGERALRFVAQQDMPPGEAYEAFIARTACVPTRDNAHDLFNGLVWLRFAPLKRQLNALQAQQIALAGITSQRGPVRDALTLFDENAALLHAPEVLVNALRRRDWQALFVAQRAAWSRARLTLFGHALLEKLLQPRKPITAHVWLLPEASVLSPCEPDALPIDLPDPTWFAHNPQLALPVLGVPGWWAANEDPRFYVDDSVFRPALPRGTSLSATQPPT